MTGRLHYRTAGAENGVETAAVAADLCLHHRVQDVRHIGQPCIKCGAPAGSNPSALSVSEGDHVVSPD